MMDLVCLKEMTKCRHRIESANEGVHDYLKILRNQLKVVNYLCYTFQVAFVGFVLSKHLQNYHLFIKNTQEVNKKQ